MGHYNMMMQCMLYCEHYAGIRCAPNVMLAEAYSDRLSSYWPVQMFWLGMHARMHRAGQGRAGQGRAGQGRAGQGRANATLGRGIIGKVQMTARQYSTCLCWWPTSCDSTSARTALYRRRTSPPCRLQGSSGRPFHRTSACLLPLAPNSAANTRASTATG